MKTPKTIIKTIKTEDFIRLETLYNELLGTFRKNYGDYKNHKILLKNAPKRYIDREYCQSIINESSLVCCTIKHTLITLEKIINIPEYMSVDRYNLID